MLAKYFLLIRNYVLSVSSQRKYNFYHQSTLLDAFRTNSRNIIGRNPSMVVPLLANQDLTPMLFRLHLTNSDYLQSIYQSIDFSNFKILYSPRKVGGQQRGKQISGDRGPLPPRSTTIGNDKSISSKYLATP